MGSTCMCKTHACYTLGCITTALPKPTYALLIYTAEIESRTATRAVHKDWGAKKVTKVAIF